MSRKDYILIAAALRYVLDEAGSPDKRTIGLVAVELAAQLGRHNPRFDGERFLKACGVQS